MAAVPRATLSMMRHDPTPLTISTTAPSRQASADVSPIDPGTNPTKASHQVMPCVTPAVPPSVAWARPVAPLTPSTDVCAAIQTRSPDSSAG